MASKRTFYRTVIQVEVLSEEPYHGSDLDALHYDVTSGECSGLCSDVVRNQEVDGPTMAKMLQAQGSDPEFFQLTAEGEDDSSAEELAEF